MAARRYVLTPARKAALKKAQLASARKRKGKGKGRPVKQRRKVASVKAQSIKKRRTSSSPATKSRKNFNKIKSSSRRKTIRRTAIGLTTVGAAVGAAYVYKNRERLVVAKGAEFLAIRSAKDKAKKQGKKLSKAEINKVRLEERKNHANRSRYRVQEYQSARELYRTVSKKGYNIRPTNPKPLTAFQKTVLYATGNRRSTRTISGKRSIWNKTSSVDNYTQLYTYNNYRKDVNARAVSRLNRMRGKKQGFSYKSGKTKMVISGRVFKMPF